MGVLRGSKGEGMCRITTVDSHYDSHHCRQDSDLLVKIYYELFGEWA